RADKMGSAPVKKLMLSMGLPIVLSMVLQAVYNIVDSAFVSNIEGTGELALNALTLAFPFQMLMVAIGIGTGVGMNALVSNSLGMGDEEKASMASGNALFLSCIYYVIFLLFGLFGAKYYISSQSSNPIISEMAESYLRICCVFSFGIVFFSVFEKMLQACGHSGFSTIAQISGAVVNIVLDPIMIYGLFGCPQMGVKGAAYATVIGQCVSFVTAVIFHLKADKRIKNKVCYLKPSLRIIKGIYSIGFAAIIAQALMSVMTYGMNIILGGISESAVTAYGLYYKVQQFILFAAFGLRDAITPIVAYNFGMGSKKRVTEGIKYGILDTTVIMLIGIAVVEIFAVPFSEMFGLSGETQELCIGAMRIITLSFVFAGINIALQGIFQALRGGIESLIISLGRQLVFIFPFALIFANIASSTPEYTWTVWLTFPIAELLTAIIAAVLFKRICKVRVNAIVS
ncbi:MAG: MATE family efflux transporter, partial [Huintestinicola sp.]